MAPQLDQRPGTLATTRLAVLFPAWDTGSGPDRLFVSKFRPSPLHCRRRSDPGVFGTTPPLPPTRVAGLGEVFSTRSPGPPSASHSIPPSSRTRRSLSLGAPIGATGTGRTIGHGGGPSSNDVHRGLPGSLRNLPGQRITGFPAADSEFLFPSARRSDSSRSRSSAPKST